MLLLLLILEMAPFVVRSDFWVSGYPQVGGYEVICEFCAYIQIGSLKDPLVFCIVPKPR